MGTMSKQIKKQKIAEKALDTEQLEASLEANEEVKLEQQAVENHEKFANNGQETTASFDKEVSLEKSENQETLEKDAEPVSAKSTLAENESKEIDQNMDKQEKQKSTGKGIAIIALIVALAIGGAGHFLSNKKFSEVESQISVLKQQLEQVSTLSSARSVELPNFDAEKENIAKLSEAYQQALSKISQLENEQSAYSRQITGLQNQLQKLGSAPQAEPTAWLLSDADFLLNNARRKMVLDNDIDATSSLLIEANNVLSQVADSKMSTVRDAIKADLEQLASLNKIDQNSVMQRLAQLANLLDDMPMLENETVAVSSGEVSDSLADWQQNLEKSADSFLSHFIRVSDKGKAVEKAFIAPNQEIYLRENIRLRLQIAILAVPRQQNELYKQSLEAVSTWVRSYFDVQNSNVKNFLAEIDELIEQSIYIDAPTELKSLSLLEKALNKNAKPIDKIEIEADKALEMPKQPKTDSEKPVEAVVESPASNNGQ